MRSNHLTTICILIIAWSLLLASAVLIAENGWRFLLSLRASIAFIVVLLGPILAYWVVLRHRGQPVALLAAIVAACVVATQSYLMLAEHGQAVVLLGIIEFFIIAILWVFGWVSSMLVSRNA